MVPVPTLPESEECCDCGLEDEMAEQDGCEAGLRSGCEDQVRQENDNLVQYLGRRDRAATGSDRQQWLQCGSRPVLRNSRRGTRRLGRQAETLTRQQLWLVAAEITGASCRYTVVLLATAGVNYLGGFGQ